jgi:hypothetical protein
MTLSEIQADIAEFQSILQRIPSDQDPDNLIARRIYEGLIEDRLALARAVEVETATLAS